MSGVTPRRRLSRELLHERATAPVVASLAAGVAHERAVNATASVLIFATVCSVFYFGDGQALGTMVGGAIVGATAVAIGAFVLGATARRATASR